MNKRRIAYKIIALTMALVMMPWSSFIFEQNAYAFSNSSFYHVSGEGADYEYILDEDEVKEGPFLFEDGVLDLNGNTLTINGDFIQSGEVRINKGTLIVNGDYRIQASFEDDDEEPSPVEETNLAEAYIYDTAGNIESITDEIGNVTSYDYNEWGELLSVTDANGNKTEYTYDAAGNCIEKKTPEGLDITYSYDKSYNIISAETEVQGKRIKESYTYDKMGNMTSYTDSMGRKTVYTYDALNRVSSEKAPDGSVKTYTYNSVGEVTDIECSEGKKIIIEYDPSGNVTGITSNTGSIDDRTASSKKYIYSYDDMNRLIAVKDPMGYETATSYDSLDNVTEITDAMGGKTEYIYDSASRLIETRDALGNMKAFEYDTAGRITKETNARGQETVYSYDEYGRLSGAEDEAGITTYTYDNLGNQLTVTDETGTVSRRYDKFSRVTSVTDANGKTIRYTYDELGNILSLTYPGGEIVRYEYNEDNSLNCVIDGAGNKTSYEYDSAGRLKKVTNPDGSTDEKSYDANSNLIKEVQKDASGEVLLSFEYTYDGFGNIISIKDNVENSKETAGNTAGISFDNTTGDSSDITMEYDECNRLIKYNGQEVRYDADGNMTYGPLDGNMTEFTYDCRNRLINAGDTAYSYDAENIRIKAETADYIETYVIDRVNSLSQILQITRENNNNSISDNNNYSNSYQTTTENYYYGRGLIYEIDEDDDIFIYHFDHNGSTRKITDSEGNVTASFRYDTYGELLSEWYVDEGKIIRFMYNGQLGVVTDDSGLLYMRQRYYDTDIKRFINQDVLTGVVTNSQSLNRYAYTQGNPVNYNDPFGLSPKEAVNKAVNTIHDELNIVSVVPGAVGASAQLINSLIYLCEGKYSDATKCAAQAVSTFFVGNMIGSAIGALSKASKVTKTVTAIALIGVGTYTTATSATSLYKNVKAYQEAVNQGADNSTLFHYASNIVSDTAGVAYGTATMVGGYSTLTDTYKRKATKSSNNSAATSSPKATASTGGIGSSGVREGGSGTKDIYRAVGVDEYYDIMDTGRFRGVDGSLAAKEFGNDFNETLDFANRSINRDKVAIIKVTIPEDVYNQLNHMNLDAPIFKSGTPVVEPDMLEYFNNSILNIEHAY